MFLALTYSELGVNRRKAEETLRVSQPEERKELTPSATQERNLIFCFPNHPLSERITWGSFRELSSPLPHPLKP